MKETTRANRDYVITIKLWVVFAGKPQRDGDQVGKITVGSGRVGGPRLRAVDPWLPGRNSPSTPHQLLSDGLPQRSGRNLCQVSPEIPGRAGAVIKFTRADPTIRPLAVQADHPQCFQKRCDL